MLVLSRDNEHHPVSCSLALMYTFQTPTGCKCMGKETTLTLLDAQGTMNRRYWIGFPGPTSLLLSSLVYAHSVLDAGGATSHTQPVSYSAHLQLVMSRKLYWHLPWSQKPKGRNPVNWLVHSYYIFDVTTSLEKGLIYIDSLSYTWNVGPVPFAKQQKR